MDLALIPRRTHIRYHTGRMDGYRRGVGVVVDHFYDPSEGVYVIEGDGCEAFAVLADEVMWAVLDGDRD